MCGISFLAAPGLEDGAVTERLVLANKRLHHRGPDGDGVTVANGIGLAHTRLSIIDIAGSPQPMASPGGRYCLSFNGEIYNYHDVRASLADRWSFRTTGDTEVLLAGLVCVGPAILDRMEGMWAFCLWDRERRTLVAGRDRMGKKPLYYTEWSGMLAMASELSALEALAPDADWSEDPASVADYFRYGFCLPGWTMYLGIREVRPGHILTWSPANGGIRERRWWTLKTGGAAVSQRQALTAVRQTLEAAVDDRLVADVEVGAFLSGGVDSSLVCSLANRSRRAPLKTFTIAFGDRKYDESGFARMASDVIGTEHHVETFGDWEPSQLARLVMGHVGQPFADPSLLPTALVSSVAGRRVKVALSGDGGDELFCGYERYHARTLLRWYFALPPAARRGVGRTIRALPEPMAHHSRSLLKKAHLFQDVVDRHEAETPYIANHVYPPDHAQRLFPELMSQGHAVAFPHAESARADDLLELMYADALVYLPQDILVKVDRASMASSLEVRCPFLDSRLVRLAFSFPPTWHREGMRGKRMLRAAMRAALPDRIWSRRKQGFGVPIHAWFRAELGQALEELLNTVASPLHANAFHAYLKEHRAGQRDHGFRLWNAYIYLLWKQTGARPQF